MCPSPEAIVTGVRASRAPGTSLAARGLTKRFGSFTANNEVDLLIEPGTVHVLLGENGAGKSTLMNMLYGHLTPDGGAILVNGTEENVSSPAVALDLGIGMVHQHFSLVPSLTVAQNVALGVEPGAVLYSARQVSADVAATVDRLGWDFDVDRRVGDLPVSAQQRVEILKLLHRGARVLLLDEPTALLTPTEIDDLLDVIEDLRDSGAAILLVTHKLKEVERVADVVTVIRHGLVTGSFPGGELDATELARAMTGRASIPEVRTTGAVPADARTVLAVNDLRVRGARHMAVDGLSFTVRAGEIVGIAAVEGNGQHELVQALCGLDPVHSGTITVDDLDVTGDTPRQMRRAGLSVIPADRRTQGLVGDMTLVENFALNAVAGARGFRTALLDWKGMRSRAASAVEAFDIRPGRTAAAAKSLSGGNMQKLVIARELSTDPSLVIAVSPTWGLDIGAVADIQGRIVGLRDAGCAVLLSSPDLDELLALSDRVLVLYRGRLMAEFARDDLDMDELSTALMGVAQVGTN